MRFQLSFMMPGLLLLPAITLGQVFASEPEWPPVGSHLVQSSPPTSSPDGVTLMDLDMGGFTQPAALKKGLNAVNVKQARMTGTAVLGDGSVRKLDGLFDASFTALYTDTTQGVNDFDFSCDVVEYKDGEDGVMHTRPGNHKPGKMTVQRFGSGYQISSFFDIFLDLSFDGGKTFSQFTDPVHFDLRPTPEPASISGMVIGGLALLRRRRRLAG